MSVSVIYDDSNTKFSYSGNQWTHQTNANLLYNNTVSVCDTTFHNSSTTTASLTIYFWGTDIVMYGPAANGGAFNYTIDSTSVRPGETSSNSIGKHGGEIWSLEGLDNKTYHSLEVFPSAGVFNFDYITFTPVVYTTIAGSNFILDDADDTISYSSGWTSTSSGSYGDAIPYKGTVTSSSTAGSTMTFNFIGASISVYGLLNQNSGKLSASFSVDGGSTVGYSPFDGSQSVSASQWSPNQLFFHQDLVPGNHTLSVKVNEVTGSQALYIDSLVFEATASTPISKADAAAKAKAANPTTTTSSSSGGLSGGVYAAIIIAGIIAFLMFYWFKQKARAYLATMTAFRAQHNRTPPSSRPPVLRRPYHPVGSLSAAEDGSAGPIPPPFRTPSPVWNSPPAPFPTHRPPMFPIPNHPAEMEMGSLRESTIPLLMPTPFVPVVGPSPRRDTLPPVNVGSAIHGPPLSPVGQHQDGSDGNTHFPPASGLTSDGLANIASTHIPQTHQPPFGSEHSTVSGKQVVLTYPIANDAAAASSSTTRASGSRLAPPRSETMNSDAPPPYTDGT